MRRREVRANSTKLFGEFQCIADLECWKAFAGDPDDAVHHAHKPSEAEVRAWHAANGATYLEKNGHILRTLGLPDVR